MKILVIDDHDELRAEITEYLQRGGHEVAACGSVATARNALYAMLANAEPPQAIVSDVQLPDGNGVDLYVDFASRAPQCQWVLLSGDHDLDLLESGLKGRAGPAPVILDKPASLRVLRQLLEKGSLP